MALAPLMTSKLPMPLSCFNACSWPNNALSDAQTVQIPLLSLVQPAIWIRMCLEENKSILLHGTAQQ